MDNFVYAYYQRICDGSEVVGKWVRMLYAHIVQGIGQRIGAVKDAVTGVAGKIKSFLHFSVPDMMRGLAEGINKSRKYVEKAVSSYCRCNVNYNAVGL